jgi:copper chaperone
MINTHELHVTGMTCQHCVKAVTSALEALDPKAQVQVHLPEGLVTVQTAASRLQVQQTIEDEGYAVVA